MALPNKCQSSEWKESRRGWCWGQESFRESLLELIAGKQGRRHHGDELKESDQQKAERLVAQALKRERWTEKELQARRKGDPVKARLAAELRAQTTMTWPWIAGRLAMGHWRTAANAARLTE